MDEQKYCLDLIRNVFMFIAMCGASIPLMDYLSKKRKSIARALPLLYKIILTPLWLLSMATIIVGIHSFNAGTILFLISCSLMTIILLCYPIFLLGMLCHMKFSSPVVSSPPSSPPPTTGSVVSSPPSSSPPTTGSVQ